MVGYGREDLVSGRLSWREITPDKWREADEQALAELAATGVCEPFEKECSRKDGSHVPVLVGAAFLEGSRDEGVAFVLDLTERKLAEETVRKTLAELAHVARVTTMGELVTSIAHEVNQPLAAIATNAQVCLRWLTRDVPNLEEVRKAAELIARDGTRASDVISRIRALVRKTGSEKEQLNIDRAIEEVVHLMEEEALRKGVVLRTELAGDLPFVLADRVQLQQVLLNLIINGVEAMSSVADGRRELLVYSCLHESKQVLVGVQDFGFGIEPENLKKIFDPFYTTKSQGMGWGWQSVAPLLRIMAGNYGPRRMTAREQHLNLRF
jgi:PAS domain S-box-containing protein